MMHALEKANILKYRLHQAASSGWGKQPWQGGSPSHASFISPSPPAPGAIFLLRNFSSPAGPT